MGKSYRFDKWDDTSNHKNKKKSKNRKTDRKLKQALKSQNLDYIMDLEDQQDANV